MLKEELNYDQNHYLNISFSTEISAPYWGNWLNFKLSFFLKFYKFCFAGGGMKKSISDFCCLIS